MKILDLCIQRLENRERERPLFSVIWSCGGLYFPALSVFFVLYLYRARVCYVCIVKWFVYVANWPVSIDIISESDAYHYTKRL